MNIVVIYSNTRKESTYHGVQMFKAALSALAEVEYREFFLLPDAPQACLGCFTCFSRGEDKCPHAASYQPIIQAMLNADGVILSSPTFALDISGAMKNLMDHMCYLWLTHRPSKQMFRKPVMAIATTAGAGAARTVRTMTRDAGYWGVKKALGYGLRVQAASWLEVSPKRQATMQRQLTNKARAFHRVLQNTDKPNRRLKIRFLFPLMGKSMASYPPGSTLYRDAQYWKEHRWTEGERPY